jgi:hypothetical protein
MFSAARMAASVTHLVSVKVIEGFVSTFRCWTSIAVMWIEAVIHVAVEPVGSVEPGASPDEHAAGEPLGPVVPVWSAVVWGVVIITIRATRLCSDIDRDLGGCGARAVRQSRKQDGKSKEFPIMHKFSPHSGKGNADARIAITGRA